MRDREIGSLLTLSRNMAPESACVSDSHNGQKFGKVSSVSSMDSIHGNAQVCHFC